MYDDGGGEGLFLFFRYVVYLALLEMQMDTFQP